jgi:hypothetical protein
MFGLEGVRVFQGRSFLLCKPCTRWDTNPDACRTGFFHQGLRKTENLQQKAENQVLCSIPFH